MSSEAIEEEVVSEEEHQAQLSEKLQVFGARLLKSIQSRISKRSDVEKRWLEDYRQFHGEYDPETAEKLKESEGSEIYVNLTRNKTNAFEARLSDMLFPTDDRNWGIKPTPVPDLAELVEKDDQEGEDARRIMAAAKAAAEAMTTEIEDQLNESDYPAICRDAIHDAALLGTGIIKGPVVVGRTIKQWVVNNDGTTTLSIKDDLRPGTQYVDPWDFYPESGATKLGYSTRNFERHELTRKQVRDLVKTPGYLEDQLRLVLGEEATNSQQTATDHRNQLRAITGNTDIAESNNYEMWEYNGPIEKDDLLSAGIEVDEDELVEYCGTILFIGTHVVRVSLHPMDTEDELYRVFNLEKDRSSIFGFGVPYLMRNPQKVMCGAWRMILDNGGLSAGPQIVYDEDAIEPDDGKYELTPRKLWKKKKMSVAVSDAFAVYDIRNNQNDLMNIFTVARQLADEETNLPLIAQGEQASHVTKTAQGMEMLMNSANIVLRRAVKNWDDDVTRPHIEAYYNWNMQFNPKREIKGDFKIDARGTGALLAREMQQQRLLQFAQVASSNQEFQIRTDWNGLFRQIAKHMQISKDEIVLDESKVKENLDKARNQEPSIDPVQKAKIQLDQQKLDMEWKKFIATLNQDRELRLVQIASQEEMTITQLKEKVGLEVFKEQNKRDIEAGRQTISQTDQAMKMQNMEAGYDSY